MKRPDSFLRRERVRTATAARHQRDDRDNTPNRYRDSSPPTAACRLLHVGQSTEPGRNDQRAPRAAVPFPGMGSDLRLRDYVGADRDRIVANLLEARRLGMLRNGANVVLYAHGAGLTRYGAALRWQPTG